MPKKILVILLLILLAVPCGISSFSESNESSSSLQPLCEVEYDEDAMPITYTF